MDDEKPEGQLETWAIVEVMGHSRYAGFVKQVPMGGAAMIRVDVPEIPDRIEDFEDWEESHDGKMQKIIKNREVKGTPAFTKFLGVSSIFAITPCTKEAAIAAVKSFRSAPVTIIDLPQRRALPYYENDD